MLEINIIELEINIIELSFTSSFRSMIISYPKKNDIKSFNKGELILNKK